jgi:hypothetical protein
MVVFTAATILWGFARLVHLGMDDLQVCQLWQPFHIWFGMRFCVSNFEYAYNWDVLGELTTAGRTGGGGVVVNILDRILEILAAYPNIAATAFGGAAAFVSGIVGWILKRPLQRQAIATERQRTENELFRMQIEGFEALISSLQSQLAYHRSQESIRDEYEATLIRQLRECRAARFKEERRDGDPAC